MSGIRRLVGALALSVAGLALAASAALAVVYPDSMAATGASATRAALTCEGRPDCSANSWATGTNPEVNSIYLRIRAVHPAITGNVYLDAVGGENMSDLSDQFEATIEHRVEFVIVDMGGNDICAPEERQVTSLASFRSDFETAMNRLLAARPTTRIAVVSIVDVYHLWDIYKGTRAATDQWTRNGTCASMLANPLSRTRAEEERRRRVREAEIALNGALATVCARYANCEYDRGTAFEFRFERGDVGRDYFHPSLTGQASNAAVEWEVPWMF